MNVTADTLHNLPQSWKTMLLLGILMVALGGIGVGLSVALTITSVVFFGAFLLVGGCIQLAHALFGKEIEDWRGRALHMVTAILYIIGGLLAIFNPIAGSFALTAMLAGVFLGIGIYRIYVSLEYRKANDERWYVPALIGVIDILVAAAIMMGMPWTALWVIGLFIALELIMNGAILIGVALAKRKQEQQALGA